MPADIPIPDASASEKRMSVVKLMFRSGNFIVADQAKGPRAFPRSRAL